METKQESSAVWGQTSDNDSGNGTQVHFEGGTVAQIVYSDDQTDRGQQQVVYTADGNSYTSVESAEHTLVYIHPADGTQVRTACIYGRQLSVSNAFPSMADMADPPLSPLGATDSTDDSDEDEDEDSEMDDWEPRLPQSFNPHSLWCDECSNANPSVCLKHGPLHPVPNRPVMSKARASLPLVLYIDRFLGGVFTKRRIPKRTQFGPVEGHLASQGELQDHYIHLKVKRLDYGEKADDMWLNLSDEDSCNWMMFVRPAQNHLEQNLVAYQYGSEIFYTSIKNIQPKQELKVWYAASYAEFVNQKIHNVTEEERKVLREQEKNWPCYECNRRFVSSEQLQQHLNMHDDKLNSVTRSRGRGRGRGKRRFGTGRRPGRPPKFIRLDPPVDAGGEKIAVRDTLMHSEHAEGAQNRLKVVEMESEAAPGTEAEGQLIPPAGEPVSESVTPSQSDAHLTSQDMRRAKRIRNAALQHLFIRKSFRPFKCTHCGKAFRDKDKLDQHLRVHGRDAYAFACHICSKSFTSDSALEDHLLVHTENRSYSCLLCTETFERLDLLKDHVGMHAVNGCFTCPSCKKTFTDFIQVKKHIRCFHSEKVFQCPDCEKAFCRPDKLRLHMLRHSDRKDFLCSTCGKQFKRKDKLREHMQRMHNPDREAKKADRIHRSKTLKLKVPTTDFESFMFKCRVCMMGFRRRGMLVNHLSKRHPEMRIDDVPELTLPIIKPNRDYFCQYCDKNQSVQVYKSASKRKAHILKNHPGAELPPSIRKLRPAAPGEPDPMLSTHTQLTGTIATAPVCCPHCAKQYSSKTKMVQHIRKKHPEFAQLVNTIQAPLTTAVISSAPAVISADGTAAEAVVTTDLLTQAMTELSQTLTTDYRTAQGDYQRIQYIPVSQAGGNLSQPQHIQLQVVQVAPASPPHSQHATVDVSQLHDPHGYSQHSIQVQHIQVNEASGTGQGDSQVNTQPSDSDNNTRCGSHNASSTQQQQQQQGTVQHAYIPGNWNYCESCTCSHVIQSDCMIFLSASEIQMMALPHTQYVIAEASPPVSGVNSNQVKTTHYIISEGQTELETKQTIPQSTTQGHVEHLEQQPANQQATTQYIITTTTNGSGTSEVHITKP
uniref:PR domain zinc finger protein 10 n=1 Tax=Cyclopterus lumpus TaxID=8103 RepID=A0A8C2X0E2_CYCLU